MWAKFKDTKETKHSLFGESQVAGYVFKLQKVDRHSRNTHKLKFSTK